MMIIQPTTTEECDAVVDKILEDHACAIVSGVGILAVEMPELAITLFFRMCQERAKKIKEEVSTVISAIDTSDRYLIGIDINSENPVLLYGVTEAAFMKISRELEHDGLIEAEKVTIQ